MIAAVCWGYLIGSLPLGYIAGRRWGGVDLRAVGSKNVGATNMYRVAGAGLGLVVMLLDLAKGVVAVMVGGADETTRVVAGVSAMAGHVYPIWLGGRGGKGVATACGVFLQLTPVATAAAAVVFAMAVWQSRAVSVGSLAASVTLPIAAAMTGAATPVVVGSGLASVLIVWRHRENVARLWRGTERTLTPREDPPHA